MVAPPPVIHIFMLRHMVQASVYFLRLQSLVLRLQIPIRPAPLLHLHLRLFFPLPSSSPAIALILIDLQWMFKNIMISYVFFIFLGYGCSGTLFLHLFFVFVGLVRFFIVRPSAPPAPICKTPPNQKNKKPHKTQCF